MVIQGGQEIISPARILIVETSFRELYLGLRLFGEIYDLLRDMGFTFGGILDQLNSPLDGSVLQADSIFIKKRYP